MKKIINATLVFPIKENKILLGLKQNKVSAGKRSGYGGKFELGTDYCIDDTCRRELFEETGEGLECNIKDLNPHAIINFTLNSSEEESYKMKGFIYTVSKFEGEFTDNDEMIKHEWFEPNDEMYDQMLNDNKLFLPKVLNGDYFIGEIISLDGKVEKCFLEDITKEELYRIFKEN